MCVVLHKLELVVLERLDIGFVEFNQVANQHELLLNVLLRFGGWEAVSRFILSPNGTSIVSKVDAVRNAPKYLLQILECPEDRIAVSIHWAPD